MHLGVWTAPNSICTCLLRDALSAKEMKILDYLTRIYNFYSIFNWDLSAVFIRQKKKTYERVVFLHIPCVKTVHMTEANIQLKKQF